MRIAAAARVTRRRLSRGGLAAALIAVALGGPAVGGCGGGDQPEAAGARPDDAFVVRAARQQQAGLALARTGVDRARTRGLARDMVRLRERTLGLLAGPLGRVAGRGAGADLAASTQPAAADPTPAGLRRARPFERAFLLVMLRHEEDALKLAGAQLRRGKDPAIQAIAQRMSVDTAREMTRVRRRLIALAKRSR